MTGEHDVGAGDLAAERAGAAARGPDQGLPPVTSLLRSDAVILMLARSALDAGDGDASAQLAARRVLDEELRALARWPSGDDYVRAAEDYDRLGLPREAALLRRAAAAGNLLAEARTRWNARYDDRPAAPAQQLTASMRDAGLIDFDPAGPLAGTDGASYEPGALEAGSIPSPVLVITGRGSQELVVDWPGFDAMYAWVAGRGTAAAGPLTPPPVPGDCRAWEEDQVLARLVTSPRDARDLTQGLRPDTFTTDVRYELYQAVLHLSTADGGYYTPAHVAGRLTSQLAAAPPHALTSYGGPAGPFPHAYLKRLMATEVTREQAVSTVASLAREDARYRAQAVRGPQHAAGHENVVGRRPARTQAAPAQEPVSAVPVRVGLPPVGRPAPPAPCNSPPGPRP